MKFLTYVLLLIYQVVEGASEVVLKAALAYKLKTKTMSVNKIIIIGNVCANPEIRATKDGKEIANFSVATSETWKNKDGSKGEKTQFHRVSAFGGVVNIIKNYVVKGSKVYLEGSMEYGEYEKDGQKVKTANIILQGFGSKIELLGSKPNDNNNAPTAWEKAENALKESEATESPLDDDIPF